MAEWSPGTPRGPFRTAEACGMAHLDAFGKFWVSLSGRPLSDKWSLSGRPVSLSGRPVSKLVAHWAPSGRPLSETGRQIAKPKNFRHTPRCATPHGSAVPKGPHGVPGDRSAMRFGGGQSQILNGTPGSLCGAGTHAPGVVCSREPYPFGPSSPVGLFLVKESNPPPYRGGG